MIHECISELRKKKQIVYDDEVFEMHQQEQVSIPDVMDVEHIQRLIDHLPNGYRTVFVLYAIEGYKHIEIAEMLNISESTSKTQLFKARQVLQQKINAQRVSEQA